MVADNSYSRLVVWLKILLPLAALVMLSSLFLVSQRINPEDAIPYSDGTPADRLREPKLTDPVFTGVSTDGGAVTVTAVEMRPLPGSLTEGTATTLTVRIEATDGAVTTLDAATGQINTDTTDVVLGGGVVVTTSDGYRLTSPDMTGSLTPSDLLATGGVHGESPFGTITSDRMHITPDPAAPAANVLDFIGDVRLIYVPQP